MKKSQWIAGESRCIIVILFLCFAYSNQIWAQQADVGGTVIDELDTPMFGVNVLIKGTTTGTVTDFDGNYVIQAEPGDILVFSYTGYRTKEVTVGETTSVDVQLEPDTAQLEEVVVVGYGSRKKSDVVSAVSTVDEDFLEQQPSSDATRALQGSASGVTVVPSARPGQQAQVRIRGLGSINGNNPLYVVDGVFGAALPPPGQIESIQVLKDASSTAIYGARGASGVVLVTTKAGRKGQQATVQVNVRSGVGTSNAQYDLMTNPIEIGQMIWLEQTNSGIEPNHAHFQFNPNDINDVRVNDYLFPNGASFGDASTDPSLYDLNSYPITVTNQEGTDWMDELMRTAYMHDYDVSVSGGSEKTTYAFNAGFFSEEGVLRNNSFNRYSARINVDSELTDWLTIGQRMGLTYSESKGNTVGFNVIVEVSPLIPVRDIAGNWAGGHVGGNLNDGPNPVGNNFRQRKDLRKNLNATGNVYAQIKFAKDFSFKTLLGYNMNWFSNHDPRFGDPENTNGSEVHTLFEARSDDLTWNWSNTLNYTKTFADKHELDVLLGLESTRFTFDQISAGRAGFISTDDDFFLLGSGAGDITNGSNAAAWSLFSLFSRLYYSFDNKYMLEATVRRDGSSRFGANNRYGTFPAVSLGWDVAQEGFMAGAEDWLYQLKLRAGWGQSGNDQIGNYNGFTLFGSTLGSSYYGLGGGDNTIVQGFQSTAFGNPDAKWETTESTNIGLDVGFSGGLSLSVDLWKKDTKDMLFPSTIPAVEGIANAPFVNVGTMQNKGIDLELRYNKSVNEDFSYRASLNFSAYKNEVTKLSDDADDFLVGRVERSQTYTRVEPGRAFPEFYGYVVDGLFQTQAEADAHPANGDYNQPGNLKIRDIYGDGEITPEDRTWIGNPHPDFTAGLNLGVNYKNFDLSAIFYASVGNDLINYFNRFTRYGLFQGPKSPDRLYRSWGSPFLADNADAVLPRALAQTSFEQNPHSGMVESGTFLRMKNIQLGYNLPPDVLDRMGLASLRLYVMGTNLLTFFDDYSGLDVEVTPTFEIDRGFDEGTWPQPKQIIFGLNLSL